MTANQYLTGEACEQICKAVDEIDELSMPLRLDRRLQLLPAVVRLTVALWENESAVSRQSDSKASECLKRLMARLEPKNAAQGE